MPPPHRPPPFPYTTLFRSGDPGSSMAEPNADQVNERIGAAITIASTNEDTASDESPAARWNGESGPSGWAVTKDRKSTRLNSSHLGISYAVFCLKKKKQT